MEYWNNILQSYQFRQNYKIRKKKKNLHARKKYFRRAMLEELVEMD